MVEGPIHVAVRYTPVLGAGGGEDGYSTVPTEDAHSSPLGRELLSVRAPGILIVADEVVRLAVIVVPLRKGDADDTRAE